MNEELTIILGLGIVTALFSYFGFAFLNKEDNQIKGFNPYKALGIFFFLLAVMFINMIIHAILLIALNGGLTYFSDGVLAVALNITMWGSIGGIALYLFGLTFGSLVLFYQWVSGMMGGKRQQRRKTDTEDS